MSEQTESPDLDVYKLPGGELVHREDLVDRLIAAVATTAAVAVANTRTVTYLERENERLRAVTTPADQDAADLRTLMTRAISLLRPLGGMLPGTREVVDLVIELLTVDDPAGGR